MIRAYVGDFGSGKTLNMVWDIMQALKRGRHVISNTPIKFFYKPLFGKGRLYASEFIPDGKKFQQAIAYRENCVLAIDEAAVYLPNLYWNKLPPELIVKFAQNRKYRTDIWYTTQGYGQAVKRLRELTHIVYLCYKKRVLFMPDISFKLLKRKVYIRGWKMYVAKKFNPAFFHGEPSQKKYERYYYGSRILYPSQVKRIYKAYDTMYVVDFSAMMNVRGFQQPTKSTSEDIEAIQNVESVVPTDQLIDTGFIKVPQSSLPN